MTPARRLESRVESNRIRIRLCPPAIEHRRQIGTAAEPGLLRHDETRVHMNGRDIRIPRMRDERNASGPEMRIGFGAVDLLGEFRRERTVHG